MRIKSAICVLKVTQNISKIKFSDFSSEKKKRIETSFEPDRDYSYHYKRNRPSCRILFVKITRCLREIVAREAVSRRPKCIQR